MNELGKLMVLAGAVLVMAGVMVWSGFGRGWFGRLPGDIHYQKGGFSFYFPVVTCIVLSVLLTILMRIFRK